MEQAKRIGIFGGTFNPIHNSHVYLVQEFYQALSLEKVLLIPTFSPPHKNAQDLASGRDRLAMCQIVAEENSFLSVCPYEVEKGGLSYTYETVDYLKKGDPHAKLYLLMGADMFLTFQDWKKPEEIAKNAVLCTIPREQNEYEILLEHGKVLENLGAIWEVLRIAPKPLSSTEIRRDIKNGISVKDKLPAGVWEYIQAHGLYQKEKA